MISLLRQAHCRPSWILADIHECGEHIHLIVLVEVHTYTKQLRNLFLQPFPTHEGATTGLICVAVLGRHLGFCGKIKGVKFFCQKMFLKGLNYREKHFLLDWKIWNTYIIFFTNLIYPNGRHIEFWHFGLL